jgi:hypothetical protein
VAARRACHCSSWGADAIVTVTFTEGAGLTTVTTLIDIGSKEARDAAVATGMTDEHY